MKPFKIENIGMLSSYSQEVLDKFPVRKSKKQKKAFRDDTVAKLQALGWDTSVQSKGSFIQSNNIIAGSPSTAKVVLTAHYDTPARLPFPNLITPCNLFFVLIYQLLLALALFLPITALVVVLKFLGLSFGITYFILIFLILLVLWLVLAGPANPSNVNDNTSGVLVLLEAAKKIPAELRKDVAIVFFDNEELGLVGSSVFGKQYGKLEHAILLNFDCVGNGDTLSFFPSYGLKTNKNLPSSIKASFSNPDLRKIFIPEKGFVFYPSDQMIFPKSIAVCALTKNPVIGYYIARIHTKRDTVMQAQNITQLSSGIEQFTYNITSAGEK